MNKDVFVSVIIPMYNRENTINMAVNSVLNQTYGNFELLVVDDCSTDGSVNAVKSIADDRIRIIKCEKNGGACVARNIGIENAKGEIIAFHDSDDCWHNDKLEKSLCELEKNKADMVFSSVFRKGEVKYGEQGRIVPTYNLNSCEDKLARVLCSNCVSTQTIVVKKEVLADIRFDKQLPRFQDWDFALQILQKGAKVYFIEEPLVDCYVMSDSITSDTSKAVRALKIIEKKYKNEFKKYPNSYIKFCWNTAHFLEVRKISGSEYFKKAYNTKKSTGMLVKYLLSKAGCYRLLCELMDKCMNREAGQ